MKTTASWNRFSKILLSFLPVALPSLAPGDGLDVLHWRNPVPTANNFTAITFGSGQFVAVDDAGTVLATPDGVSWEVRGSITPGPLKAVAHGGGRFVTVGPKGKIFSSDDAVTWVARSSGSTQTLNSITYGNGVFVTVGDAGTILTSPDGTAWMSQSSGASEHLPSVAYGGGVFVASGKADRVLTSPDAITWTPRTIPNFASGSWVTYGNGFFLLAGFYVTRPSMPGTWISTNGADWRLSSFNPSFTGIGFGAGLFVNLRVFSGAPTAAVAYSADAVSWFNRLLPEGANPVSVAYGNGAFVAVGLGGSVVRSTNASDWVLTSSGDRTLHIAAAAYGAGKQVLVGSTILTSSDDLTYHRIDGVASNLTAVVYADGKFIAVGDGGTLVRSTDGTAWVPVRSGTVKTLRGLAHGGGKFVAVGDEGRIQVSDDGVLWSGRGSGTDYHLHAVTYAQSKFVAVGDLGVVLMSPNGSDWAPQQTEDLNALLSIAFGAGQFVAVGQGGTIMTSPDGSNWTRQSLETPTTLNSVAYGGGIFVATGSSGTVANAGLFSSPDGIHWEVRNPATSAAFNGAAYVNGTFLLFGIYGLLLQSDPVGAIALSPLLNPDSGDFEVTVSGGEIGQTYRLQACTNLSVFNWFDVTTFTKTQNQTRLRVTTGPVSRQCYYRVVTP